MDVRTGQKIARLTPLPEVIDALGALVRPVRPRHVASPDAVGFVLAADVVSPSLPGRPIALNDGWAVRADELADASGYAPAALSTIPLWVEAGDELPEGIDAVAPPDVIVAHGDKAEAVNAVTPGEGVALAGSELNGTDALRRAGQNVRLFDVAVFEAAGIHQVSVRAPRILIVPARQDLRLRPAIQLIAHDCAARGGEPMVRNGIEPNDAMKVGDCDAVVVVGGSGVGHRDQSVRALVKFGQLEIHGIGLMPGETAALGHAGPRPVLIVPGQLGSAMAVWLTLGRTMLAELAGQTETEIPTTMKLSRKVSSTVGLAAFVPVRHNGIEADPLASRYFPLSVLVRANGWLLVPPESEGFPAGAQVAIYNLP